MGDKDSIESLVGEEKAETRVEFNAEKTVLEMDDQVECNGLLDQEQDCGRTELEDQETDEIKSEGLKYVSPAKSSASITASHVTFDVTSMTRETNSKNEHIPVGKKHRLRKKWGWVVVVASWIVMIPIAGTLSSFGTIVGSLSEEFNATKLETGWIGALAFSFTVGTCPFSTPLFNIYGGRKIAGLGVFSGSLTILITSFIPVLYLMFLTYSVLFGISANFVYNSGMSLTGQYFPSKHQAPATCLASAGISFGTLLMNPFSEFLVSQLGWRYTLRILSAIILVVGIICVATFKPVKTYQQKLVTKLKHMKNDDRDRVLEIEAGSHKDLDKVAITASLQNCHESKISLAAQEIKKNVFDKRMYDCSFCNNPPFILWMLGTLFWSLSFLFPLIFLIDYMISLGISGSKGALVMTAYGIAEFVGRIICAAIADKIKFSLAYVYAISCGIGGFATLLAPQWSSLELMFVFGICVGLNSGVLNSLMFATTMQLFGNQRGTHIWGYINVMLALGMVIGPVTAGGIYDATKSYKSAFYMGGGMFVLSAITMLLLPISLRYFPPTEPEAKGKREKAEEPESNHKRISKPRNSLRTMLISQQIGKDKPKWKNGAATELKELNEIQMAYEESTDSNEETTPSKNENGLLLE